MDALIEAGQEEGILDESNRDLIQSVVEFSEKTVREAMKPRPEIVAVPTNTTVEQFIELLRTRPFSRVPVYEDSIHNIVGIVFAQDVLQVPDTEAHYRTVDTIMRRMSISFRRASWSATCCARCSRTTSAWQSLWTNTAV